ncbi:DEAD/DEAH box helicase [Wenzhouxiangella sp. AB-CW3]|uniref:DEAD/DEAH box helicase n=1 Tax=Wenzhouxiangella sp. AB-CW3 TaxID=2771012 RepID=UPI00168AE6EA|nr:DEAD/DEAH box helicase [Wenzhouxiangella sp. AB-CW3]QOC23433.1 DEAD/DEAH box helicase [Wenzhouxiangella sp. AB-CW3]
MKLFGAEHELDVWFERELGSPTAIQREAWPLLRQRRNALLIAATGQGKSLAAWRPVVERLADQSDEERAVRALHIAPLKALARDMTHNLAPMLAAAGRVSGRPLTMGLRCGDTPQFERLRQRKQPPDLLSTTPESLFVLLGSHGGRALLRSVEAVVVDEIHALADTKRGAHLALSLARLDRLVARPVQRIGLSATARPATALAELLGGQWPCEVINPQPPGAVALKLELPETPLGAWPGTVHWQQIHDRIVSLALGDRSLLVFCQTRAQVERTSAAIDERLVEHGQPGQVGAHHGSLDTSHRETIESRFRQGALRVMVSSASLELGLDLGHVDRVCQIGAPGSVNLVRQRAGRSGHRPGKRPCMHLFPLTRNQLIEATALAGCLDAGTIDHTTIPRGASDVLAQHLVAMLAAERLDVPAILQTVQTARPFGEVSRQTVEDLLAALAASPEDMPLQQFKPLVEPDGSGGWRVAPRAGRLALANAGTIPEFFEYDVVRADSGETVGRLDEEFAFESSPGQVLQLGRRAWKILRVSTGEVLVDPADDEPAELPFWFGEGPGRTREVAAAVLGVYDGERAASLHPQAMEMLAESRSVLGCLPGPNRLIIEQVTDPGGDRHVVLHTLAGARINRAWGLALRKRFCRQFNFELQAAATDDGILISLGVTSRFELAEVVSFVRSHNVADVLTQALLDTPLFLTRFRWCANNALVLLKTGPAGRIPAQRQRSQAENLIACVFPDQLACLENLSGPRQVPDHPLVRQALNDCLNDYMDLPGLIDLLERIEQGRLQVHAVETSQPSPLAEAMIHAPPHSFLDEAAAEERRTRNFEQPATTSHPRLPRAMPGSGGAARSMAGEPSPPDNAVAIAGVAGIRPSADALDDLLHAAGFLTQREGETGIGLGAPRPAGGWTGWFAQLLRERRALSLCSDDERPRIWISAAWLDWFLLLDPTRQATPPAGSVPREPPPATAEDARQWLIEARRRIDGDHAAQTVARLFPQN